VALCSQLGAHKSLRVAGKLMRGGKQAIRGNARKREKKGQEREGGGGTIDGRVASN